MYKRVKIKKGDTVKVISGGQKGKSGRVIEVVRRTDRVLVEGVNIITKHIKPSATNPQGGIEKREAPVHISNVMYVDDKGNATRVGRRRGDDGKLVRVSVKTKEELK
ncbi:MAG: 50S ribosomal protein L24 [Flavobacteriales bacterium]|nr:50S ribosomal protein L24 [Flavobacteriales bacterium]